MDAFNKKVISSTNDEHSSYNMPSPKVLFPNADSLTTSKMVELKKMIETEKPLIVSVCEVKPKNTKGNSRMDMDYETPGYSIHPVNLNNENGIAIYSHISLDKSTIQIEPDLNFEETCLLETRLRGGGTLLFACCNRSPTKTPTSDQNNVKLNQLLRHISRKKYTHKCIVGDFNYRHINWSTWTNTM